MADARNVHTKTRIGVVMVLAAAIACHTSSSDVLESKPSQPAEDPAEEPAEDPGASAPTPELADEAGSDAKEPGPPQNEVGADELHRLEGEPESALLAELGQPTRKREFTMSECCTEFSIELYNTYPPDAGHEAVPIHEWTWDYEGYALTVWLHQHEGEWQVLETSRYSDDVEF